MKLNPGQYNTLMGALNAALDQYHADALKAQDEGEELVSVSLYQECDRVLQLKHYIEEQYEH